MVMAGMTVMLVWSADSWDSLQEVIKFSAIMCITEKKKKKKYIYNIIYIFLNNYTYSVL